MTYLDAAYAVLRAAGQPLHFEKVADRALAEGLITPQGRTPAATMGSRLYTDTKQEGSRFTRAGHGRFGLTQWQPKGIDAHVQEINDGTRAQLAALVQAMPPERFEALIRELLVQMGFDENTVKVTPYSSDGGIDVTGAYRAAGLTEISAAVQAKKWKGNVGAPVVTQLRGSLQVHQQGIIITTSDFSKSAREEASAPNKTRIGLINGKDLIDLLIKHQVGVVKRTLEVTALDDEYWGELVGRPAEAVYDESETLAAVADAPHAAADHAPRSDKPRGFRLLGQQHDAGSWRSVLLGVCEALAEQHGDEFGPSAMEVRGRTRQYIASTQDGMIAPAPIPSTDLWLETNQSAVSAMRLMEKLLTALGHQPEDLAIEY